MIKHYYLYFSYPKYKDTLFIYFSFENADLTEKRIEDVSSIYNKQGKLHSYRIYNISRFLKIKSDGLIFEPSPILIKAINFILENAGFEKLEQIYESKYLIASVKKISSEGIELSYRDKQYLDSHCKLNLSINDFVVIALPYSILSDFSIVSEIIHHSKIKNCHICTEFDLGISLLKTPLILKNTIEKPFFFTEE